MWKRVVRQSTRLLTAGLAGVALATLAVADPTPPPLKSATITGIGVVLTAPNGMTLYVYLNDREPGKSVCTGAYKGKPLYYCKTDKKPGDVTGHKFRDFWLAAQP